MATTTPLGFHRLKNGLMSGPFIKGHLYFNSELHKIYLANGTTLQDLEEFTSDVKSATWNPNTQQLIITRFIGTIDTVDLSVYAKQATIGSLTNLETDNKSSVVDAINEVLAAVEAGGTGSKVTVTEGSSSSYAKIYTIKQGTSTVGTINIPKDMVVSSGTVEKDPEGQTEPGLYLVLTLANATSDKIYINLNQLIDVYTAEANATQIQLTIDPTNNKISAKIVAGSVTATELASNAVTSTKIATAAVTAQKLSQDILDVLELAKEALQEEDIDTGTSNGTIKVGNKYVAVKGLGTAAYQPTSAFDPAGSANTALNQAKAYAESLQQWKTWEE